MEEQINIYSDPNAFIKRDVVKREPKQKVDLAHIEKVFYPQPYENAPRYFEKKGSCPPQSQPQPAPSQRPFFDINKLLPLLSGKGNLSSILPNILANLGVNKDILPFLNNFNKPKTVESKVVENFDDNSISKYEKVNKN